MLPGLIDSHCHILPTGLDLLRPSLAAVDSREEALEKLETALKNHEGGWMHVVQYDQNRFAEASHLTREELDRISTEVPILLRHSNGHAGVANTAALEAAKIDPDIVDPEGGTFVRDESGSLNGVLLERANEIVSNRAPQPTHEEMVAAILRAGDAMARVGLTQAADMLTGRWNLERELLAYSEAARQGCKVRLHLYMIWSAVFGAKAIGDDRLREISNSMNSSDCRIAGIKIFADGAIGSATAGVREPYTVGGLGTMIYTAERLAQMVETADQAGYPIAIHSIGDRSTDIVMDAFERTQDPSRHRIEHVMLLDDAQIARLKKMNLFTTMQPEFLARFGKGYRNMLGDARASSLKRARSVLDAGVRLALNSDRPIVEGDPLIGMRTAVERPQGYGPEENIQWHEAFDGYTGAAASILGIEPNALSPGDPADFTIVDSWPPKHGDSAVATYKQGDPTYQDSVNTST